MRWFKKNAFPLLAMLGLALSGCTVKVVDDQPKGTCLYHHEGKAACAEKTTQSDCAARYGTWSQETKDCPD